MNKTIWMFWSQGWNNTLPLCRYCLDSWEHYNPGWKVITLDESNYRDYVDIDSVLPGVQTNPTAFSDILRLFLLKKYGGVWADATLFCNKPLDDWLNDEFFIFTRKDTMVSSWFLYSEPEGYVISSWYDRMVEYWKERLSGKDRLRGDYIWVHRLFAECYKTDSEYSSRIDRMTKINSIAPPHVRGSGPHMFTPYQKYLNETLNDTIKDRIDSKVDPCYKLTHKNPISTDSNTCVSYLFNTVYPMKKTHYIYDDGTQFLSYHDNHGYYFPFIDRRMDHMSKNGPFDKWLKEKYTCDGISIQEGDTVIDCGSFVGAFSIAAASSGASKVYAIEPSSRNFNCIKKNLDHFSAESIIEPVNIGLGDKCTTLRLNLSSMSCEDSFLKCDEGSTGEYEEVDVLTLDKFIGDHSIDESKLYLKVEAEGFEYEIIKGLGQRRPRSISIDVTPERNGKSPRNEIKELLVSMGYKTVDTNRCLFATV